MYWGMGFKIMYEDGHTVCDFCDKDHGIFYVYKGEDMCEYCWRERK
jgi:hypothetical protein